jgi:hydroxymethylglutaryl-CoA lyase
MLYSGVGTVLDRARQAGLAARGYVSMCFGDPWEGPAAPAAVAGVARRQFELGCAEISLGDPSGWAPRGRWSTCSTP